MPRSHPNIERLRRLFRRTPPPRVDAQGGMLPRDIDMAKAADLVTLPEGIPGKNCFNCWFANKANRVQSSAAGSGYEEPGIVATAFCRNPEVWQYVTDRNSCKHWDNTGVMRDGKVGEWLET